MRHALDTTNWLDLHQRVIEGDQAALLLVCDAALPTITARLRRHRPLADPHLIAECVDDTLLAYAAEPGRFRTARNVRLLTYLTGCAKKRLANALRKEETHRRHEQASGLYLEGGRNISGSPSELCAGGDNISVEGSLETQRLQALLKVLSALSAREQEEVALLIANRRPTRVWAMLLGVGSCPPQEQKRRVHREKDRLVRRLRRHAEKEMRKGESNEASATPPPCLGYFTDIQSLDA